MDNFSSQPVPSPSLDQATREKLVSVPTTSSSPPPGTASSGGFWSKNKVFVVVLIAAIAAIGLLAWFLLRAKDKPIPVQVKLEVTAPGQVASGTEAVVKLVATNGHSQGLSDGELDLVLPDGVVFISSNPEARNLSGTSYAVPKLSTGANAAIFVKLKFEGETGTSKILQAKLHYGLEGYSAKFEALGEATVNLGASGVSLDLSGPAELSNSKQAELHVRYANQSRQALGRIRIKLVYPQSFQFASSIPAPSQGQDTWDVDGLAAGSKGEIVLAGSFVGASPGTTAPFLAQLLVADSNGNYYLQTETKFSVHIASQNLTVEQRLQSSSNELVAEPGALLRYDLNYHNNATTAARGVRIVFTVESSTVDLASIQAEGSVISGKTVTWSAAAKPELEVLNPGEQGSVSVSMKVKDPPVQDKSINPNLVTSVKIIGDDYPAFMPGGSLDVKIATKTTLEASQVYVSGQRPPRVGQATRYQVSINLRNTTSEVKDALLTAFVAGGSESFESSSFNPQEAGAASFDPATGKITWKVGTLAAHSGTFNLPRALQFGVRLIPSASQAGQAAPLVREIILSGTDVNTGRKVLLQQARLTTSDGRNDNNGIVQP